MRAVPVLSLFSQKGGVAKSTLAISLAWELMKRGEGVVIVDADPQQTCQDACVRASSPGIYGRPPPCVTVGEDARHEVADLAHRYKWVILDTPGRLGLVSRSALVVSDLVLVPVRPSAPDAWALDQTLELIGQARELRPELRAAMVLTQVRPTRLAEQAEKQLRQMTEPLFRARTTMRVAWEQSLAFGEGVTEFAPKSVAAQELRAILAELKRFHVARRNRR